MANVVGEQGLILFVGGSMRFVNILIRVFLEAFTLFGLVAYGYLFFKVF
jgi:hypothetical protein